MIINRFFEKIDNKITIIIKKPLDVNDRYHTNWNRDYEKLSNICN